MIADAAALRIAAETALRAAASAGMNAAERFHVDRHHGGEPGPGHIAEAGRTITAFLQALPGVLNLGRAGILWTQELAAEVEAAAAARPDV